MINCALMLLIMTFAKAQNGLIGPFVPTDFCLESGFLAADGTQKKINTCSDTPMGSIPSADKMVSTLITAPINGAVLDANSDIVVSLVNSNLITGFFSDPNSQYYLFPQDLDPATGFIKGHQHVTVQLISNTNFAPDPQQFVFFKGLNDPAVDGTLSVVIPAGTLGVGLHRICSISGAESHQPVVMPVAQRGSQDDCIRVQIVNQDSVANQNSNSQNNVPFGKFRKGNRFENVQNKQVI